MRHQRAMLSQNAGRFPHRERVWDCPGAICADRSDGGGARDGEPGVPRLGGSDRCGTKLWMLRAHSTPTPTPLRGEWPGGIGKGPWLSSWPRALGNFAAALGAATQDQRIRSARNRAPDRGQRECSLQTPPTFGMESRLAYSDRVVIFGPRSCAPKIVRFCVCCRSVTIASLDAECEPKPVRFFLGC